MLPRASDLVHLYKYRPAESDTPVEELWGTVWGGIWRTAWERQWVDGEEREPGVGHNLLRIDCFTWILLKCPRGRGLTFTEKEAAVMGEDKWSGEREASPNL